LRKGGTNKNTTKLAVGLERPEQPGRNSLALEQVKGKGVYSSLWKPITELRSVTCHMGSHSVTCHPTQVNVPRFNPSHAVRYLIYLPRRDERLSWPWCWLYTEMVYLSTDSHPSK